MAKYPDAWANLDSNNAEQYWKDPFWTGVIVAASRYPTANLWDETDPIFAELRKIVDEDGNTADWYSYDGNPPEGRPFLRGYRSPWTKTKVFKEPIGKLNPNITLTPRGMKVASGELSFHDVLMLLFDEWCLDNEKPFKILASAFVEGPDKLTNRDVYHGIMGGYRPGIDDATEAVAAVRNQGLTVSRDTWRGFSRYPKLLAEVGGVSNAPPNWEVLDVPLLARIAEWGPDFVKEFHDATQQTGLTFDIEFVRRFVASLLTKRFVILSGLTGSGKTRLALELPAWLGCSETDNTLAVVAVGPDWIGRDYVLGYPDALDQQRYVRTKILDLLLAAKESSDKPHFLVLDEMNLSHVERYFADILSSMESGKSIELHGGDPKDRNGVPAALDMLPKNVFIIGTVNIDETTHMFSPKVLDRANVLEFRVTSQQMEDFLAIINSPRASLAASLMNGSTRAHGFLKLSESYPTLGSIEGAKLKTEVLLLFDVLAGFSAEFGFRTAQEVWRFAAFYELLLPDGSDWFSSAVDAQICQKLLPKLHGSRSKLEPVLLGLAALSLERRDWSTTNPGELSNASAIKASVMTAKEGQGVDPLLLADDVLNGIVQPEYPISFDKISRMLKRLREDGFASFAEG